jgi:hypothetical protein
LSDLLLVDIYKYRYVTATPWRSGLYNWVIRKRELQNRAGSGRAFNDIFPKVHTAAKIANN